VKRDHQCGFTLFEMLIVLAIMASASALTFAWVKSAPERIDAVSSEIMLSLSETRMDALSQGKTTSFVFDIARRHFVRSGTRRTIELDADISVRLLTAKVSDTKRPEIRFFSDGASSGGEILLSDGREQRRVIISWLTGRIAASASAP
jgi:general secretion pathway protein H